MTAEQGVEINVSGEISTNHNRENINLWREKLATSFSCLPPNILIGKKLSIVMHFWLNQKRLTSNTGNDIDNLVKPVFDIMKRMEIIIDDAFVYQVIATKFPTSGTEELSMIIKEWRS